MQYSAIEQEDYMQFTKPAYLHKSINTLRGMVAGMAMHDSVSDKELSELIHWCSLHENLRDRHPFSELLPMIDAAIADSVISEDERNDILWLCNNFVDDSKYYDIVTSTIQFLSGILHGILADGVLSDEEIFRLKRWTECHDFLKGTYPFDEINSLLHTVLLDGRIDTSERETLMAFFSNFIDFRDSYNLKECDYLDLQNKYSIQGVCAYSPEVDFENKLFCFTGQASGGSRSELVNIITSHGGIFRNSVSKKTDYLVVGIGGNPCWAYSCYGRKIEEALVLRKNGARVLIINENDFWNAVKQHKMSEA